MVDFFIAFLLATVINGFYVVLRQRAARLTVEKYQRQKWLLSFKDFARLIIDVPYLDPATRQQLQHKETIYAGENGNFVLITDLTKNHRRFKKRLNHASRDLYLESYLAWVVAYGLILLINHYL